MGKSSNQPTQAAAGTPPFGSALAGGVNNTGGAQPDAMPPRYDAPNQLGGGLVPARRFVPSDNMPRGGFAQPAVMPPQFPENRMPGYGGQGVMRPAVDMPIVRGIPRRYPQPMPRPQPNIFQQSAASLNQAQRTLGGLSQFQPRPMVAARAAPTATYGGATVERTPAFAGATVERTPAFAGATVERTAGPQFAQIGDMQTYGGATIDPIERARAAQLGEAERMQGVGAVQAAQAPEQIGVDQLRTTDISSYMSPYQQQVIEAGQADIERQRQMASENLAAQAQRAGAFGGSRQAVQEGVLAGEALRQAADLSARQRQAGFQQAVESGKFDIGTTQQARTLASQQEFQASQLGQQAREAAAAREQAARAGNMQAANQFAQQQAQLEQQATLANQAAFNTRAQAQAGLTQQAGLASMQAVNQRTMQQAQFEQQAAMAAAAQEAARASQQAGLTQAAGLTAAQQDAARAAQQAGLTQAAGLTAAQQDAARAAQQAGLTQAAGLSNQAAINQAVQAQAAREQAARQAMFGGQFQGAGIRQAAAGGLSALGGQQFGIGQQVQGAIGQQGQFQRGLQQQLLDRATGQYGGATGAPMAGLGALTSVLSGVPYGTTSTSRTPFNPLGLIGAFI